jgi:hypothetical protein
MVTQHGGAGRPQRSGHRTMRTDLQAVVPSVRIETTKSGVLLAVAQLMREIDERQNRAGWEFTAPVLYRVLRDPVHLVAWPMRLNLRDGGELWHKIAERARNAATCPGNLFDALFPGPLLTHIFFTEVNVADAREQMHGVRIRVLVAVVGNSLLILQRAKGYHSEFRRHEDGRGEILNLTAIQEALELFQRNVDNRFRIGF